MTKKQRIVQWLNIFLLIINISAFITFLMMNRPKSQKHDDRFSSDQFMKNELNLTPAQYAKVNSLNNNIFRIYQVFLDKKCELNFELIDELSSEHPSQTKMDSLCERIGKLDANLKKQSVQHFKNIKSVCSDKQKLLLDQLMKDMLDAGDQCKYCNKIDCARRERLEKK